MSYCRLYREDQKRNGAKLEMKGTQAMTKLTDEIPTVSKYGILSMQVCVPKTFTDQEILSFAEKEFPAGTSAGWSIRREGSKLLQGAPERNQCEELPNHVHIMLDC